MAAIDSTDVMEKTCCPQCGGIVKEGQCTQCGRLCRDEELVDWDTACYIAAKQEQKNRPKHRRSLKRIGKWIIGFAIAAFIVQLLGALSMNAVLRSEEIRLPMYNFIACLVFAFIGFAVYVWGYIKEK